MASLGLGSIEPLGLGLPDLGAPEGEPDLGTPDLGTPEGLLDLGTPDGALVEGIFFVVGALVFFSVLKLKLLGLTLQLGSKAIIFLKLTYLDLRFIAPILTVPRGGAMP